MPTVETDVPVHFEDTGGDAPAVVFSHGFLMDHRMFAPQVSELAPDFRCIRWDARGFGKTPAAGPFSYWNLADDVVALMDHLGVETAVLVGMSQGGYISLRAALRYPQRVNGMVLIDSQAAADDEETVAGYREMFDAWLEHGPSDELMSTLADMILGPDEELRAQWIARWKAMDPDRLRFPVECLLGREDVTDRLDEIRAPTLMIHGVEDPAIPVGVAAELNARLPRSQGVVRVEGAVHAPNLTHPQVVNPALRHFLEAHG